MPFFTWTLIASNGCFFIFCFPFRLYPDCLFLFLAFFLRFYFIFIFCFSFFYFFEGDFYGNTQNYSKDFYFLITVFNPGFKQPGYPISRALQTKMVILFCCLQGQLKRNKKNSRHYQ
ncbi:MAG TPA: hypothetical protein DEH00_01025 [Candidatus Marinimicrobia bacterium]|nr:hypothetical protein [Candidatus Neomarinimicrobiota bacterium]